MIHHRKINVKTALGIVTIAYLVILTFHVEGKGFLSVGPFFNNISGDTIPTKTKKDSILLIKKFQIRIDSLGSKSAGTDSVKRTDTIKISNDSIDAPIKYHAEDSAGRP